MLMEYIVPSLLITMETGMDDVEALEERIVQLIQLEKDCLILGFHQQVAKGREKAWHDRHIKKINFVEGYLVLLYNSKFIKHLGKFQTHWLGSYLVHSITYGGVVQLQQLDGVVLSTLVNGSRLKPYRMGQELRTT